MIIQKYLSHAASVMPVNVPDSLITPLKSLVASGEYPMDMFDAIESSVKVNLMDTFQRFRYTTPYQTYIIAEKKQRELAQV